MEIARWRHSCCMCVTGCKNVKDTLLLLLYFQQLLTFYCNLFSFSPPLKNNTTTTIVVINHQLSRLKNISAEDCFCQQRVPKLGAHGRFTERILYETQLAAHRSTLSATFPFGFF